MDWISIFQEIFIELTVLLIAFIARKLYEFISLSLKKTLKHTNKKKNKR